MWRAARQILSPARLEFPIGAPAGPRGQAGGLRAQGRDCDTDRMIADSQPYRCSRSDRTYRHKIAGTAWPFRPFSRGFAVLLKVRAASRSRSLCQVLLRSVSGGNISPPDHPFLGLSALDPDPQPSKTLPLGAFRPQAEG